MTEGGARIKNWHVLVWLSLFFGVVFAVNGTFIYLALATHPGDDQKDAYVAGLEYNKEIAEMRAQQKLGWRATLSVKPDGPAGEFIELAFVDVAGNPVRGLKLEAELRSPVTASLDHPIKFKGAEPGVFRASVAEAPQAQWDLVVEARSDLGQVFRLRHRL